MPTTITRKGGAVRLTVTSRVANDLGSLQVALKNLADRLGHSACATGCDIFHIGQEQEFTFSGDAVALNPQPLPPRIGFERARGTVTVTLPERVNGNIELLNKAVGNVLGKLGCGACCSGFDILFLNEMNTIALDEKGGVARFGGAF